GSPASMRIHRSGEPRKNRLTITVCNPTTSGATRRRFREPDELAENENASDRETARDRGRPVRVLDNVVMTPDKLGARRGRREREKRAAEVGSRDRDRG